MSPESGRKRHDSHHIREDTPLARWVVQLEHKLKRLKDSQVALIESDGAKRFLKAAFDHAASPSV